MIPQPIKYDKAIHFSELITKALDPNDVVFIRSVISSIKNDNAEPYIVEYSNDRIAICRKGLQPARIEPSKTHHYFALKNRSGKIITNGKNSRRVETIICVLRALFRRNRERRELLKESSDLTVAERCAIFNYSLLKQGEPFK